MSSVAATPPLFARVRAATAAQHAALEARIDPLNRFSSVQVYGRYLARAHPLYLALENELARHDWVSLGLDFDQRRKAALISADLSFLGVPPVREDPPLPGFPDLPTAIGTLYVLEGATHGGQVIGRHLKTLGLQPGRGASFFNAYGPRTATMWKTFQDAALRGVRDESDTRKAIAGAQSMFELFGQWMTA